MHILPVFLVHVLVILISLHGTKHIYFMASRATYQNILSGGDIFSSKSKMYYRHRKYILYKFMYKLFFGIAYGHLCSIRMKNEIFSKK